MFVNIQNRLTPEGVGCELVGFAHTGIGDHPRIYSISQSKFISKMMSDTGRTALLKHQPPFSVEEINAVAETWEKKRPKIGNRIFWETKKDEDPRLVPAKIATIAAKKILEQSGLNAANLGLIVATSNTSRIFPTVAHHTKAGLADCGSSIEGRSKAECFNVSNACTGGSVVIKTVWNYIRNGNYKYALAIAAENAPILTKYDDYKGSNLFSIGAFASLWKESDRESLIYLYNEDLPYDGNLDLIYEDINGNFYQDGQRVHGWVARDALDHLMEALELAGIKGHHIDALLFHQASGTTMDVVKEKVFKRLPSLKKENFYQDTIGNTSCASTGILFSKLVEKGIIKKGQLVVVSTFGGGLGAGSYALIY